MIGLKLKGVRKNDIYAKHIEKISYRPNSNVVAEMRVINMYMESICVEEFNSFSNSRTLGCSRRALYSGA